MRDVLARITKHWLPIGLTVVVLAAVWLVTVFGDQVGVPLEPNIAILALSIGGGLLGACVAPKHPLRNGMLGALPSSHSRGRHGPCTRRRWAR